MARNVERHTQLSHARSIASTLPSTKTDSTDDTPQILTNDGTLLHGDHFLFILHFHRHLLILILILILAPKVPNQTMKLLSLYLCIRLAN